jgi:hypothetical protein
MITNLIINLVTALCLCGGGGATATGKAVRLDPPPPPTTIPVPILWTTESSNGRCVGLIDALEYWDPGWNVQQMAAIAYRESRCQPDASNSCCSGVFQIHRIWIPKAASCDVYSRSDLYDPWKNVCTAAIIYRDQGMSAWSQTL